MKMKNWAHVGIALLISVMGQNAFAASTPPTNAQLYALIQTLQSQQASDQSSITAQASSIATLNSQVEALQAAVKTLQGSGGGSPAGTTISAGTLGFR